MDLTGSGEELGLPGLSQSKTFEVVISAKPSSVGKTTILKATDAKIITS